MPTKIKKNQSLELVRHAAMLAAEKKAIEIVVLDLRKISGFTDFLLICTGVVDVHVRAIYEHIDKELRALGVRSAHVEGESSSTWVLVDYFDMIVNVFQPETRGYYALEKLWGDAPRVELPEEILTPNES